MTLGVKARIHRLHRKIEKYCERKAIAIKLIQYKKSPVGPVPTGLESDIIGGLWNPIAEKYDVLDGTSDVVEISCYSTQYDFILDDHRYSTLTAGRMAGKTTSAAIKLLKLMIERVESTGIVLAPSYDHCLRIFDKIRALIPHEIILDYEWIAGSKYLQLINGSILYAKSSTQDKYLRSLSADYGCVDEAQAIKNVAIESFVPCFRESKKPQFFEIGTISRGDFYERHLENVELEKKGRAKNYILNPTESPYIDEEIFELVTDKLSGIGYRIEIESDWSAIEEENDDKIKVFPMLTASKHLVNINTFSVQDITSLITYQHPLIRKRCDYIVGVDPNTAWPNYAVIFKIYHPNILVAVDQVIRMGSMTNLVKGLAKRGITKSNSIIIDDKTGRHKSIYSDDPIAPTTRLTEAGYRIIGLGRQNPAISDTVESVLNKIEFDDLNAPTILISTKLLGNRKVGAREYPLLWESLTNLQWAGEKFFKGNQDITHGPDCLRYVAHFFFPAQIKKQKLRLYL